MCGPQRALTVPTHSGRVCSYTDATVPTGLQLQAPLFRGGRICGCRPDTIWASAPARVGWLLRGTGGTVLPASHLQGSPPASHGTQPAELETESRPRSGERKLAMTSQSEGSIIQHHQPLFPVFQRTFITLFSPECRSSPRSTIFFLNFRYYCYF